MSTEREQRFDKRMSDHEALMWNVEKDPWLNPSGGSLVLLDRPIEHEYLVAKIRLAVSKLPRLYERVVPGLGRLAPPVWAPDPEFDLRHHVRRVTLSGGGDQRELFDLATRLYEEPFDRTRPLWRFVAIDGVSGGRGALFSILHHAIADGIGQMRMAEMFQDISPETPPVPEVDLEALVADAVGRTSRNAIGGNTGVSLLGTARNSLGHVGRRQLGLARRVAGEVAIWPADPRRAGDVAETVVDTSKTLVEQLTGSGDEIPGGSPLWQNRSRHRHLEHVRVSLSALKDAAHRHGTTINGVFLAALADASFRHHERVGIAVEAFNFSFVVSTRHDSAVGGNSFTPVPVQLSGAAMTPEHRLADTTARLAEARDEALQSGGLMRLSSIVNLLPTSVVTRAARSRAARLDVATSNLRGAPFPLYVGGALIEGFVTMGPVAGTAGNITALSYLDHFDLGLFLDPEAIVDPAGFRDDLAQAFDVMLG